MLITCAQPEEEHKTRFKCAFHLDNVFNSISMTLFTALESPTTKQYVRPTAERNSYFGCSIDTIPAHNSNNNRMGPVLSRGE